MKKILFILHYPPPVHGAAMVGQYIRDSELVNSSFNCRYINLGTSITVDEIGENGWRKWRRYVGILWGTVIMLIRFKPQLVYVTPTASGPGFYKDALVALLAKAFCKKVVYHFHNKGVSKRQDKWLDHTLYKMVFKNAEVILLSEQLYPDIGKYVHEMRVHFCANGIPPYPNKSEERMQKDPNHKVQILFLSNLIESKGVYVLLNACKHLQSEKVPFECVFVGGDGDISTNELKEKIRQLGLEDAIQYLGPKYGTEKEAVLAKVDILVLPTSYPNECFPLVLLEAMQFSLPVVATFEGGIPDIVVDGKTGFLVQQGDVTALAEKLEILIRDPAMRIAMGKKGRKRYGTLFTLEVFEKRFYDIIEQIV